MKKITKYAFTLIELVIVISLIVLLTLGINKINIANISNKSKLNRLTAILKGAIEIAQYNSLLGKGVPRAGGVIETPQYYKVKISTAAKGSFIIMQKGEIGSETEFTNYKKPQFAVAGTQEILGIKCQDITGLLEEPVSNISIIIKGSKLSLSSTDTCSTPILVITLKGGQFKKEVTANTITGLISSKNITP